MGWKNLEDLRKYKERKSYRYSIEGWKLELEVASVLAEMWKEKSITKFVQHRRWSREDHSGKDFTVWRNDGAERSFGVTISLRSWRDSKAKHPKVPQLCFPIGTKPKTIQKRILELFELPV